MTERAQKPITISVKIQPGPATPAQREQWRHFWQKMIAEAKSEAAK
jgi:hypothetical protein